MKRLKNILTVLIMVFTWTSELKAREPYPLIDAKTSLVTLEYKNAGLLYNNSTTFLISHMQESFNLSHEAYPASQNTASYSEILSEHYFVRPNIRKEFRLVRFLDNSLQISFTKLIIAL